MKKYQVSLVYSSKVKGISFSPESTEAKREKGEFDLLSDAAYYFWSCRLMTVNYAFVLILLWEELLTSSCNVLFKHEKRNFNLLEDNCPPQSLLPVHIPLEKRIAINQINPVNSTIVNPLELPRLISLDDE